MAYTNPHVAALMRQLHTARDEHLGEDQWESISVRDYSVGREWRPIAELPANEVAAVV